MLTRRDAGTRKIRGEESLLSQLRNAVGAGTETNASSVLALTAGSFATGFDLFHDATIVIAQHGAAMVNVPFMRVNSGLIQLDVTGPPLAPFIPSWIHFEALRINCVKNSGVGCSHFLPQFNDWTLDEAQRLQLVELVKRLLKDMASSLSGKRIIRL